MGKILILGATSGVAEAVCREMIERGDSLVLAARNMENLGRVAKRLDERTGCGPVACLSFDALDLETHGAFVGEALSHGPFDGCFVSFGVHHKQALCERDWKLAEETIRCNYTGTVSILEGLSGHFADRGNGFISCVTSVAGDRGRKSNYIYGSSKAGLNAYLEGLRHRLHGSGVLVQTVKLGPVDTPMAAVADRAPFMVSPERAAKGIVGALARRREVAYVPWFWLFIMLAVRLTPRFIFKRTKL